MTLFGLPLARFLIIVISVYIVLSVLYNYLKQKKGYTVLKTGVLIVIWLLIAIISYNPNFAYYISEKLGFGQNLNTLIFVGFIVVFALIFRLLKSIEKLEREISEIVRKEALKDLDDIKKKK